MAPSNSVDREFEDELKDVGIRLLYDTSSIVQLLSLLDKAENVLSKMKQAPAPSVEVAMLPIMKALILPELISHSEIDVKASVAACLHEIMRITAPEAPYDDKKMEEIFKLTVMLLNKLSLEDGHCYTKAVSILLNMASVRSCLVMLDNELDELIVEMFQLFFKIISPHHPAFVSSAIETIMTHVINEIEEIPFQLLSPLLFSMRKENQDISPLSYKLGENVFKKCAAKLKPYLPEGLRLLATDVNNYAEIVSSIYQNASGRDSKMTPAAEPVHDANGTQTQVEKISAKLLESISGKNGDLGKGNQNNYNSSTAHGEDKSASPFQINSFSEGSRKRGRPKKNKDPINLAGDSLKESSIEKKVSFSGDESLSMKSCKANGKGKHNPKKQKMFKKNFGEELIGRRIKVWWPMDETFYEGVVYSYNPVGKRHRVLYVDGEEELLNLRTETWEFVGENNFEEQGKDSASETCEKREKEEQKNNGTAKKAKSKRQNFRSSKDQSVNFYAETGSSDRSKKKKKKSKNSEVGGEARKE